MRDEERNEEELTKLLKQWADVLAASPDPTFQPELSAFLSTAEFPQGLAEFLDRNVVEPTREANKASPEQCAGLWYNVGLAVVYLPKPERPALEFAIDCGQLAGRWGADSPDLWIRSRFLAPRVLHLLVADEKTTSPELCRSLLLRTTEFIDAVAASKSGLTPDQYYEHVTVAYSIAISTLKHLVDVRRAIGSLDLELGQLVQRALELVSSVPAAIASRVRRTVMQGMDADDYLRFVGVYAHWSKATDEWPSSKEDARCALSYLGQLLADGETLPASWRNLLVHMNSSLLLLVGDYEGALNDVDAQLHGASPDLRDALIRTKGQCLYRLGRIEEARLALESIAESVDEALDAWRQRWLTVSPSGQVLTDLTSSCPLVQSQTTWRQLALISSKHGDIDDMVAWMNRANGFLVDSLFHERERWIRDLRRRVHGPEHATVGWSASGEDWDKILADLNAPSGMTPQVSDPTGEVEVVSIGNPGVREQLLELSSNLPEGTALLQTLVTEEGILTAVTRFADGGVKTERSSSLRSAKVLVEKMRAWDRFYIDATRSGRTPRSWKEVGEGLLQEVLDEGTLHWGETLETLVRDGITTLVFVSDDITADLPFAAVPIGEDTLLIDRVRVVHVPSIGSLWASSRRQELNADQRKGVLLRSLADPHLAGATREARELADILVTEPTLVDPTGSDLWNEVSAANVLHIVAHGVHNVLRPLSSRLLAGWIDLGLNKLIAGMDLPRCQVVSNLICESDFPAIRRAPGLGFSSVFLGAGARNVLASTWVVEDLYAHDFALHFFRAWVRGLSPSEAHQEAILKLRECHALQDVRWAGIRLVGAP